MKRIKALIVILSLLLVSGVPVCAKESLSDSYNLNRAYEEGNKGNYSEAIEFFKKEIDEHPRNSYAYIGLAGVYYEQKKYDEAYSEVTTAFEFVPKKDKHLMAIAFMLKGDILLAITDTIGAIKDYDEALKLNPKFADVYEKRGQIYYELKNYDLSDADYHKLVELNPAYSPGYIGLGINANEQEKYDEAIKLYGKALNIDSENSLAYAYRAESYLAQKNYLKAIDDICKALSIDGDPTAYYLLFDFPIEQEQLIEAKLKRLAAETPHSAQYLFDLAQIYNKNRHYEKSNEILEKALEIDVHPAILRLMAGNYQKLGDYNMALDCINRSLQIDPDNVDAITTKGDILGDLGDYDGAIREWTTYIDLVPDYFGGYYRRGFFEDYSERTDEALSDYEMAILLEPKDAYAHLGKGDMLMRKGDSENALDEYKKVIELDTIPNNSSCAMYAFLALGEKDKAIDFMNRMIEQDSIHAGNYYDAACLYSRMGDLDKSMDYLRQSIENGFSRFHHIMTDDDLEALRETDAFKMFYNEHKEQFEPVKITELMIVDENGDNISNEILSKSGKVEIPFTPEGGCASVKCSINDLPLNFILIPEPVLFQYLS